MTPDESGSVVDFVLPPGPVYWQGEANNHLLNTLLMRVSINVLGLSPFAIRLPAVLAGITYCAFAAALSLTLFKENWRRMLLYILLVFNPFLLDYLSAGRGYAFGLAGQLGIIWMLALTLSGTNYDEEKGEKKIRRRVDLWRAIYIRQLYFCSHHIAVVVHVFCSTITKA